MIEDSSNTLGLLHYGESIVRLWSWYLHYHNQNLHQCTYPPTQHMLLQLFLYRKRYIASKELIYWCNISFLIILLQYIYFCINIFLYIDFSFSKYAIQVALLASRNIWHCTKWHCTKWTQVILNAINWWRWMIATFGGRK